MDKNAAPSQVLTVLEQTPIILEKILLAATPEQLHWKPAPERWSVSEVLSHLVEVEKIFRQRAKAIAEQDFPSIESYDQEAAYRRGDYSTGRAEDHLRRFCHERDLSVSWLRYLPAAALARKGNHSEIGEFTLDELLHEWAFHDLGHIRQVSELYRSRAFYPRMGGFQQYYSVKP